MRATVLLECHLCVCDFDDCLVALSVSEVIFFASSKYSGAHHLFPCHHKLLASKCIKTDVRSCKLLSLLSRTLSVYRPVKKSCLVHL